MSTYFSTPSSKDLHRVSSLILGVKLFQIKAFCIFCIPQTGLRLGLLMLDMQF